MPRHTGSNTLLFFLLLALLLGLAACSTQSPRNTSLARPLPSSTRVNLRDQALVKSRLLQQYREWFKTPYKMGGLSKNGVDCSGFTYLTFRSRLGHPIPRTTKDQVRVGTRVARSSLRPGDLVFFHTSAFYNHVGIYLGDATFLHASTSHGVMISSMNLKYWNSRYWTARRVSN